jgi:capsid portal protein
VTQANQKRARTTTEELRKNNDEARRNARRIHEITKMLDEFEDRIVATKERFSTRELMDQHIWKIVGFCMDNKHTLDSNSFTRDVRDLLHKAISEVQQTLETVISEQRSYEAEKKAFRAVKKEWNAKHARGMELFEKHQPVIREGKIVQIQCDEQILAEKLQSWLVSLMPKFEEEEEVEQS